MSERLSKQAVNLSLIAPLGFALLTGCSRENAPGTNANQATTPAPTPTENRCSGLPHVERVANNGFRFTINCVAGLYDPKDPYSIQKSQDLPKITSGKVFDINCLQTVDKPWYAGVVVDGSAGAINLNSESSEDLKGLGLPACPAERNE